MKPSASQRAPLWQPPPPRRTATVLSLQPGSPSSTGPGGPFLKRLQRWRAAASTPSPSRVPLCAPALHSSPSSLLLRHSLSSRPWWLAFHHLLTPAHLPPDTQRLSPELGAGRASTLKLYGTEDPSGNRKAVYPVSRKMHAPDNGHAVGLREPVTPAQGSPQRSETPQHEGAAWPLTGQLSAGPLAGPLGPQEAEPQDHHCLPGCHPSDTRTGWHTAGT